MHNIDGILLAKGFVRDKSYRFNRNMQCEHSVILNQLVIHTRPQNYQCIFVFFFSFSDQSLQDIAYARVVLELTFFIFSGVKINRGKEGKELLHSKTNIIEAVALKRKRNRSQFTKYQLQSLEKLFSRQRYLTRDERTRLARSLDMTELQIRNWFQNRRYLKKQRANENTKKDEPGSSACVRV